MKHASEIPLGYRRTELIYKLARSGGTRCTTCH